VAIGVILGIFFYRALQDTDRLLKITQQICLQVKVKPAFCKQ
jgi:hypothetical protein